MLDHLLAQLADTIDRQDYKAAVPLLKQLQAQAPESPWVRLYTARLQEAQGQFDRAETHYRRLLQKTTNSKVALQARQGIERLAANRQAQQQQAIAQASADPANSGLGFLVFEAIDPEARTQAAQAMARILKLDAYTARLQLPSRGWRLYRTGKLGELQVYGQALRDAGLPVFWVALSAIQALRVFRVQFVQSVTPSADGQPQVTVICQNEADQVGALSFNWSEVSDRVEGQLPIFESVVDVGVYGKLKRKEQTQDYAQVVDLQLPHRRCLLRLCDRTYQFHQGVLFEPPTSSQPMTTRLRWNQLLAHLDHQLMTVPVADEFTNFAATALDHLDLIDDLKSHMGLFRKTPSKWDEAFQLYSGLVLAHRKQSQP